MKNCNKYRIGFLGAGYISDWHAKAIKQIDFLELVAICDVVPTALKTFMKKWDVPNGYTCLDQMLMNQEIDAIYVLLPPQAHYLATKKILEAGKHVFLEKPMSLNTSNASELIEIAKKKNLILDVNYNFLFHPTYKKLKDDILEGKIGPIDNIIIDWSKPLPQLSKNYLNSWLLAQPAHPFYEVSAHSLAHLIDLLDYNFKYDITASDPVNIPGSRTIYRKWQLKAWTGTSSAFLNFSLRPGYPEYRIFVRGLLGSAVVDLEKGIYTLSQHSSLDPDFDRFYNLKDNAVKMLKQGKTNLKSYLFSKAKLVKTGNLYGVSINTATQEFYNKLNKNSDEKQNLDFSITISQIYESINYKNIQGNENQKKEKIYPKVLIFGASGFIGLELVRQLNAKKIPIRIFSRNKINFPNYIDQSLIEEFTGDLRITDHIAQSLEGIDIAYHLARPTVKTWQEYLEQEVEVTTNIGILCAEKKVRLIYTGTTDSYFSGNSRETITEATPLDRKIKKRNLYARSKALSEKALIDLYKKKNLNLIIFRPGIVIGPGSSPLHWGVGLWKHEIVCQIWGKGENKLPFVLVTDVAQALFIALERPDLSGEIFNLVGDIRPSAIEYLNKIEKIIHGKLKAERVGIWKFFAIDLFKYFIKILVRHPDRRLPSYRDWLTRTYRAQYDCSKAKEILKWCPTNDLNQFEKIGLKVPVQEYLL